MHVKYEIPSSLKSSIPHTITDGTEGGIRAIIRCRKAVTVMLVFLHIALFGTDDDDCHSKYLLQGLKNCIVLPNPLCEYGYG